MVQKLTIENLCDICEREGKETPAQTYSVDVTITGEAESPRPFVVELCPSHGSDIAKAVLALISYGRPPEKIPAANRYGRQTRTPAIPAPAPTSRAERNRQAMTCPTCGAAYETKNAMRAHLRTEHDQ